MSANALDLERELSWFSDVLAARLRSYFHEERPPFVLEDLPPPPPGAGAWSRFLQQTRIGVPERLVVVLALVPHVRPQLLDVLWARNEATQRGYTEFGGRGGGAHGGFLPTGETAAFLVAGDNLAERFALSRVFEGDHLFARQNILRLGPAEPGDPLLSGALLLSQEYVTRLTTGAERKPTFSADFPACLVETTLSWDHLVLPSATRAQLEEIGAWIQHGRTLMEDWGMAAKLRPGFTSLFHGPPGTGKTLSASLLGKRSGVDVYRVDLSAIVSKYIGETEKNLARVFDMAENRRWILFFDEADALFGRRTRVDDAHDRYANQEVSFLLQRIEEHNGVVILASNMKSNIDDAFLRRFCSVIAFPMPQAAEREAIWRGAFSERATLEARVDLRKLAARYELSGGTIMNVVRYASLRSLGRGDRSILLDDLEDGVRRELQKEGRTV